MILNRVIFAGEVVLNILHRGFNQDSISQKSIYIKEKIGRNNLIFEQKLVDNAFLNELIKEHIIFTEEGLLHPKHELNPYSHNMCTHMVHYLSGLKPKKILKTLENKFELNLSLNQVLTINEFVLKHTGVDLNRNPILYGDILVYEPTDVDFKPNQCNGITLYNLEPGFIVTLKFKKNNILVDSHIEEIKAVTQELNINSSKEWVTVDIEIFKNDDLIYYNNDLSYIKTLRLSMGIARTPKRVKLNKLNEFFELQQDPIKHETVIGETIDKLDEIFFNSNLDIRKKLLNEKEKENIIFIKPGETEKSIEIISKYLQQDHKEIWIFDPYFTDKGAFNKTLDWLRIFNQCSSEIKNIVFYCKNEENAYDFNNIKNSIEQDELLKEAINNGGIKCNFIQISSPIHDRFILGIDKYDLSGLTIGTSLNSVDTNHFCINFLNHSAAKKILAELKEYISEGNIVGSCEL